MNEGLQTILSISVPVLVAIVGVYGVRFTSRQATKAKAQELEGGAITRVTDALGATIDKLSADVTRVRNEQAQDRAEQQKRITELVADHRAQIADLREERRQHDAALNVRIDELEARDENAQQRIRALEARDDASQKRIGLLGTYIRTLIGVMRDNKIVPPPAPPGMTFD